MRIRTSCYTSHSHSVVEMVRAANILMLGNISGTEKKNSPNKLANNAAFSVPVKPSRERMSLPDSVQAGAGRRVVRSKCNCVVQILKVQT